MRYFHSSQRLLIPLALAGIAVLPYLININDSFVSDDWDFLRVARDHELPAWQHIVANTHGSFEGGTWRPAVNAFWLFFYSLFGVHSAAFHIGTLLFHVGNVLLIWLLVRRVPWIREARDRQLLAFFSAVLFALFPNHASAGAWIAVVNDTMVVFFGLLTLYALLRAKEARAVRSSSAGWWFAGSLGAFVLSLLSKEMAITIPGIIALFVLYDGIFEKKSWVRTARSFWVVVPYAAVLGLYFLFRFLAIGLVFGDYVHGEFYLATDIVWRAISTITISHVLSDGLRTTASEWLLNNAFGAGVAIFGILIALLFISFQKRWSALPWVLGGAYFLSMIPVIRFAVNVTPVYFNEEGERYAYFPSVFFALLLAFGLVCFTKFFLRRTSGLKSVLLVGYVCILVLFGAQLLYKTVRWSRAADTAERLVAETVAVLEEEAFDGVVFIGVPDMEHGAFIFRNAFALAPTFFLEGKARETDLFVTQNRTLYEPFVRFVASRQNPQTFVYEQAWDISDSVIPEHHIVAAPRVESVDYISELTVTAREPRSISYTDYGDDLLIRFADEFMETNKHKRIGIWFFNGYGGWDRFLLNEIADDALNTL